MILRVVFLEVILSLIMKHIWILKPMTYFWKPYGRSYCWYYISVSNLNYLMGGYPKRPLVTYIQMNLWEICLHPINIYILQTDEYTLIYISKQLYFSSSNSKLTQISENQNFDRRRSKHNHIFASHTFFSSTSPPHSQYMFPART